MSAAGGLGHPPCAAPNRQWPRGVPSYSGDLAEDGCDLCALIDRALGNRFWNRNKHWPSRRSSRSDPHKVAKRLHTPCNYASRPQTHPRQWCSIPGETVSGPCAISPPALRLTGDRRVGKGNVPLQHPYRQEASRRSNGFARYLTRAAGRSGQSRSESQTFCTRHSAATATAKLRIAPMCGD
jgi:hypothetical protein